MADEDQTSQQRVIDYREIGATGLKRFSGFIFEEFLQELIGWKGVQVYKEMGDNDPTVGALLFAIKMLCRRVKWRVEPASQEDYDGEAKEFLESCMDDMSHTWVDTIDEILAMLQFGYNVNEIVYKKRNGDSFDPSMRSKFTDGRIGWRKIPTRSQDTIYRWQFDDRGGIQGVEQLAPPHYYHVTIPAEKMLLFRTTVAKNNPEGRSILRNAYRPWYMKKNIENIEAIGVERDLAGLPVALVPPEILSSAATPAQKQLLNNIKEIVTNIRRDEQEGVVFPASYDAVSGKLLYELKLLSTGGTRQFDTDKIVNRYDKRIAQVALADFILLGQENVGSFALASSKTNIFATAIGAYLDIIADVFNRYAIPRLFNLNDFKLSDYPKIAHGDLESVDLKELGDYIQKLSQAGMPLFPNIELEKYLCEVAHLPAPLDDAHEVDMQVEAEEPKKPKSTIEIPDNGSPTPQGLLESNTDPVNQKPPVPKVTTNVSGDTETTSRAPTTQENNGQPEDHISLMSRATRMIRDHL